MNKKEAHLDSGNQPSSQTNSDRVCYLCGKRSHITRNCRVGTQPPIRPTSMVTLDKEGACKQCNNPPKRTVSLLDKSNEANT